MVEWWLLGQVANAVSWNEARRPRFCKRKQAGLAGYIGGFDCLWLNDFSCVTIFSDKWDDDDDVKKNNRFKLSGITYA